MKIDAILTLRAGAQTRAAIARDGVHADSFSAMLGASGGPKWLILAGLDRYLAGEFFRARTQPLALLGTSIGCWRHAYFAQRDPLSALDRFLTAYLAQSYSAKPDMAELTDAAERLLDALLGTDGVAEICANRVFRTHVLAARCRGLLACDNKPLLLTGLILAALCNGVTRSSLGFFFERALFSAQARSDFHLTGLPGFDVALDENNLRDALLATAAVPMVFAARRHISAAPAGTYRDGGITDYHFDLHMDAPAGLVLYPHFYGHLTPGWFDKMMRWRRADGALAERTLLVAPSAEFVASLPARTIPDRRDFLNMDNATREHHWRVSVAMSERLGEAFAAWLSDPEPARWLRAL